MTDPRYLPGAHSHDATHAAPWPKFALSVKEIPVLPAWIEVIRGPVRVGVRVE